MDYTYSRWDGTQGADGIDLETAMQAMLDDLLVDGNVEAAVAKIENRVIADERSTSALGSAGAPLSTPTFDSALAIFDGTSSDLPPGLNTFAECEFADDRGRVDFGAFRDELRTFALQPVLGDAGHAASGLHPGSLDSLAEMLRELNDIAGESDDTRKENFEAFAATYGQLFPGIVSRVELLGGLETRFRATQALMCSLSPSARANIEQALSAAWQHDGIVAELRNLSATILGVDSRLLPPSGYQPLGDRSMRPPDGVDLIRPFQCLENLGRRRADLPDSTEIAPFELGRSRLACGDQSLDLPDHVSTLTQRLESAGYVSRVDERVELTARGLRTLGEQALEDIFRQMKQDCSGDHAPVTHGRIEPSGTSRPYEFGNRFLPDINRTVFNAIKREGGRTPIRLKPRDFEVVDLETLNQATTVLMLDISRSMPLRGCLLAAKKVALTLQLLIQNRFPQDHLYVTVFSDRARQVRPDALHRLGWGGAGHGTNMQHGFMLARRLLAKHASENRQIVVITDGEPTAYLEGGRVHCAYPPTRRILEETLREVHRCTRDGIVINTFMLDHGGYLTDFVDRMAQINGGRAFCATPDRLATYVLTDYIARRGGHRVAPMKNT